LLLSNCPDHAMKNGRSYNVIASEAKQSMSLGGERWIASSQGLLAMTAEGHRSSSSRP
jgi:hypothetical protein